MTNANKPISKFLAGPGAHPASSLRFRDLVSIPSHSNTYQISSESDFLHRTVSLSCPNMLPGDILEVRGLVVNNVIWRRTLSDWLIHDGLDVNWSAVTGVRASDSRVNFAVKDFLAHSALHADFVVLRAGGDAGVSSHREDLKSQGAPNLKQGRSPPETPATRRGLRRRRRHRARTRGRGGVPAASIAFSVSGGHGSGRDGGSAARTHRACDPSASGDSADTGGFGRFDAADTSSRPCFNFVIRFQSSLRRSPGAAAPPLAVGMACPLDASPSSPPQLASAALNRRRRGGLLRSIAKKVSTSR